MNKPRLNSSPEEVKEYVIWLDSVGGLAVDKTLRDFFAAQATESDISAHINMNLANGNYAKTREQAKYRYADIMIEARRG